MAAGEGNGGTAGHWPHQVAGAWERHRTRLFEAQRHVSEWLVDRVDPQPGQTVLELAAGPGETGFLAAERVGAGGRLISTDLGPGMVDAARRGAAARGLTHVECRVMDGQEIDLPDASVDGVLSRFGVMLMPEPARALAGARRVLRPGRRLAYAVWGPPERNPSMSLLALAAIRSGHQPPGDPTAPGSPFALADPDRNRDLVLAAGFEDVEVVDLPGVTRFTDIDDYWDLRTSVSGSLAVFVSSLAPDDVRAVRSALEPMLEPYATPDGYALPSLAIGVAATAP